MGKGRTPSTTPDLFSTTWDRKPMTPSASSPPPTPLSTATASKTPSLPYVLPKDLPKAIKHLQDGELDRLLTAVIAERKARGKQLPPPDQSARRERVEPRPVSLPSGKLNAVRAAFKAGVKPTQIARQFGISQADVRRALASDASKA